LASTRTSSGGRRSATLGIDLASQPENTGACRIDWIGELGVVQPLPSEELTDSAVLKLILNPAITKVGIDAPFGWPIPFTDALLAYRTLGVWPDGLDSREVQATMELRVTDTEVWALLGKKPLSVSTDRIAYAAMRCARLLATLVREGVPLDRSGEGRMVEVYPAAALRCWGLSPGLHAQDPGSYKGKKPEARRRRERLVSQLQKEANGWLQIPSQVIAMCCDRDDHLDALLCALVARAADLNRLRPVGDLERARQEGWIRLPWPERLARLGETEAEYLIAAHDASR